MIPWIERSREERDLLNPSFCATIFWHAANGFKASKSRELSFAEAFLVLPLVLQRETREGLPRTTRTSLVVWLEENPLVRGRIASRAQVLVPFTKEGLLFGSVHGMFQIKDGYFRPVSAWKKSVNSVLKNSSDEVQECMKAAEFVGKWISQVQNESTVLAVVGVRP